jgi:hypothetical protein
MFLLSYLFKLMCYQKRNILISIVPESEPESEPESD